MDLRKSKSRAVAPTMAMLAPRRKSPPPPLRFDGGSSGNPSSCAEEVDDEAAVGAAAGGVAEVGHPVRRLRERQQQRRRRRLVHADVPRVRQRVPEHEHGVVLAPHPTIAAAAADATGQRRLHGAPAEAANHQHAADDV
ncbi:hypothetical protein EE612_032037, partial [Oryza sativa]